MVMTLMFIGQINLFTCKNVILKVMLIKVIDFLIVQKIYIDYVENYKQQFLSIARLQSTTVDNVQWSIWNLESSASKLKKDNDLYVPTFGASATLRIGSSTSCIKGIWTDC